MAAAPKKTDKANDANATDTGTVKSDKKKLFLIIGVAVVLILISVGGTLAALKFWRGDDNPDEAVQPVGPVALAPAIYLQLNPNFTINFNVNGRQRFLQAEITLMYRDPVLEPLLKLHMPAIRNSLVMLLSSKNFDELQTPEGKEALRTEALSAVQGIVDREQQAQASASSSTAATSKVEQVLFTTFVMQ